MSASSQRARAQRSSPWYARRHPPHRALRHPSDRPVCTRSGASITSAMSDEFFAFMYEYCWREARELLLPAA